MFNVTDYSNKDVVLKAGFVARHLMGPVYSRIGRYSK